SHGSAAGCRLRLEPSPSCNGIVSLPTLFSPSLEGSVVGNGMSVVHPRRPSDKAVKNTGMSRILIIDDDSGMRGLLESTFRAAGYEPMCAANGQEGIDIQRETPAALAIVDLVMPEKDGVVTIHELHQASPRLPIIAMTGLPNVSQLLRVSLRLGAQTLVQKPFCVDQLLATVAETLCATPAVSWNRPGDVRERGWY